MSEGVDFPADPESGRQPATTVEESLDPAAAQAAVAPEPAGREAERLAVLEERDRIARELHDTVVRRLLATTMILMSATKAAQRADVASRLRRAADELDAAVRQLRSAVFDMRPAPEDEGLRSRLRRVIDHAAAGLGSAPSVRLDGLLDTAVSGGTAEHLLAAAGEALANVALQPRVTSVQVTAELCDLGVALRVEDDGAGVPDGRRLGGLGSLAGRAAELGGFFRARPRPGGGTTLLWWVPPDAADGRSESRSPRSEPGHCSQK
ncbi:sensor histidine kinase [Actinomadura sp. K4S16]|uniref:sensor histidine kinase n=1 Tax=Actinomadura sp. K4S16 TaxID=1316147 RepID=UPI00135C556B|nr:histidine kinase [Actinomadura sp. K4S16]